MEGVAERIVWFIASKSTTSRCHYMNYADIDTAVLCPTSSMIRVLHRWMFTVDVYEYCGWHSSPLVLFLFLLLTSDLPWTLDTITRYFWTTSASSCLMAAWASTHGFSWWRRPCAHLTTCTVQHARRHIITPPRENFQRRRFPCLSPRTILAEKLAWEIHPRAVCSLAYYRNMKTIYLYIHI